MFVNETVHTQRKQKKNSAPLTLLRMRKKYEGGDNLVLALCSVHFAGDVSCNAVSDGFALDGGYFTDNSLVVLEVSIEACRVLF